MIFRTIIYLAAGIWLISFPLIAAASGPSSDPNLEALKSLLNELEQTIEEGDRRMIAHPKFLDELRSLVDRYRRKLREIFIFDDFSDGDYRHNPTWIVKSGYFEVTSDHRLWSRVYVDAPAHSSREEEPPIGLILKEIMRSTKKDKREKKKEFVEEQKASIQTLATISPAFEVDLTLVSRSRWGAMEIVLLGGTPPVPRYRLIYRAAASQERPIEIVRRRGSRDYTIESAVKYPALDDGLPHKIQWIRDAQGQMRVLVDGEEVLSTVEIFYRDKFSGLALVNRGGTYEWGPLQVLKAQEAKPH